MRENCTSGSVAGAPGNRSPYAGAHYLYYAIEFGPSGTDARVLLPENFAKYIGPLSCNPNQ